MPSVPLVIEKLCIPDDNSPRSGDLHGSVHENVESKGNATWSQAHQI